MTRPLELKGVIPPVCTPRGADGGLDRASLRRLCARMIDDGVHGLFIGGTTGEVALLDAETALAALDVAVEVAAGAVPVLFGAIDTGTERVIERARPAVDHGAAAIVATVPFYVGCAQRDILAHYARLGERIDLPVIAYDIPSATHVRLEPDTLIALAHAGDVVGAKDSSGDLAGLRWALATTRDLAFPILTGSENFADVSLACGASGVVPGLGNVDARGFVELYDAVAAADATRAGELQGRLAQLFRITEMADRTRIGSTAATIGAYKSAMVHRGLVDDAGLWPPLATLTGDEHTRVHALVEAHFLGT